MRALAAAALLAAALLAAAAAAAPVPPDRAHPKPPARLFDALPGDRPQLLPPRTEPLVGVPQVVTPPLEAGPYVFPVYGLTSVVASFGDGRAGSGFHHGVDILGELGQPLVAAADGTVFSVGWARGAGNRMWLRDHQGNVFEYAHLAAFSTSVRDGARVRAGEVVGFMGDTGASEGERTRLHFEVHPVSLLYLGADGAVDPAAYLSGWRRLQNLPFPVAAGWAPSPPGVASAPQPGAVLIGVADIASGGLRVARG
ncbi:MAG TPA: M23 family metallopeptidase [Gaiellaceae bacterium]|nr:M23 family metallopeptidase [Gaiellaceae bacterium]